MAHAYLEVVVSAAWRIDRITPALRWLVLLVEAEAQSLAGPWSATCLIAA